MKGTDDFRTSLTSLRKIKRAAQLSLAVLGFVFFVMAAIFEQQPELRSLEYIFNPFQVTLEPSPVNQQEQQWRLGS